MFAFRRVRKMHGGHDPRELQRRSAEARRRNRQQQQSQDVAAQLEQAGLKLLADESVPAYVRARVLARLSERPERIELDIGSAAPRGVSLADIATAEDEQGQGDSAPSERTERDDEGAGGPTNRRRSTPGSPSPESSTAPQESSAPSEISTAEEFDLLGTMGDPVRWLETASAIQRKKEAARPDPSARPWESWSDDYWK